MGTVFSGQAYSGNKPDAIKETIATQNTWSAPWLCPGGIGDFAVVPVIIRITGAAIVTVQTMAPDEEWDDYGDTAGITNAGMLVRPNGTVPVTGLFAVRAGIKTGHLNGGSAVVRIGTLEAAGA